MGYQALITIDLPRIDSEKRELFYEELESKKWQKIDSLTTAWKASFKDSVDRESAITTLEKHLKAAKTISKTKTVKYAIQLDKAPVTAKSMYL